MVTTATVPTLAHHVFWGKIMNGFAKLIAGQNTIEVIARVLFALVFVVFGVGKFNADDATELAGLVVQHPILEIAVNILGPVGFATLLGIVELFIAILLLAGIKTPKLGFIGAGLATGSFIVTTSLILFVPVFRENAGFPFSNFTGLFLFKDLGLLACAMLLLQLDAARVAREAC